MHDFGYVALNMKYVNPEDSGTYTCRAINELGEAVTSATLFVQCKYITYSAFISGIQYIIHFAQNPKLTKINDLLHLFIFCKLCKLSRY